MAKKAARKPAKKAVRSGAAKSKDVAAPAVAPPVDLARAFRESYVEPPAPAVHTVTLDVDVAPHFSSSRAVNEALRALLRIVKQVRS